jgi:hypothetical protein
MSFPNNCIRGIKSPTDLNEDGFPGSQVFYFDLAHDRTDGWMELSINWEDNDSVIDFTLQQRKDNGEIKFKGGIAVFPRTEIDRLNGLPRTKDLLSYERKELPKIPFHGNILLRSTTKKQKMMQIAVTIALAVTVVKRHSP